MTRLLLVRHGLSAWNAAGRWQGWADIELSAEGEDQAREAAGRLVDTPFTAVVHTGMQRTARTAELMAERLGVDELMAEPGLKEYDVGDWSGLTRPEIEERWPGALARWFNGDLPATPGGESRIAFKQRVIAALHRVAILNLGGTVLTVTHGGVVGLVQRELDGDGERPRIANLSGRWVDADDEGGLALGPLVHLLRSDHETASPSS